jgi:hypothetical protein
MGYYDFVIYFKFENTEMPNEAGRKCRFDRDGSMCALAPRNHHTEALNKMRQNGVSVTLLHPAHDSP